MRRPNVALLIPLRGGSKGIPRKNVVALAGKPLCGWALEAALDASEVTEVFASTDDDEIATYAAAKGITVDRRDPDLATDTASTEAVMEDFARRHPEIDLLCLVQATSPTLRAAWIDSCIRAVRDDPGADSALTVTRDFGFRWAEGGTALNYSPLARPRRQDWSGELVETGAVYVVERDVLLARRCRIGARPRLVEVPRHESMEVDDPTDLLHTATALRLHDPRRHRPVPASIGLLAVDVDGTLTDGGMHYGAEGETGKRFATSDGLGLNRVAAAGVTVGIITGESTPAAIRRAEKLGISRLSCSPASKVVQLDEWRRELGLDWSEVAYIGDDLNDLLCIDVCGFTACPADAAPQIRRAVTYVSPFAGGAGAVRDACERLIGTSNP